MAMTAPSLKRPKSSRTGPLRFVLTHRGSPAPAADVALIEGVPQLQVVARTDNVLLVTGVKDLVTLKAALPSLSAKWVVNPEVFYEKARG